MYPPVKHYYQVELYFHMGGYMRPYYKENDIGTKLYARRTV